MHPSQSCESGIRLGSRPVCLESDQEVEAALRRFHGVDVPTAVVTSIVESLSSSQRRLLNFAVPIAWEMVMNWSSALPTGHTPWLCSILFAQDCRHHVGGSSSAAPGVAWLLPTVARSSEELAEALLHEAVHAAIFQAAEEMPVFKEDAPLSNPEWFCLTPVQAKVRDLVKAFHAAVIARAVLEYRSRSNHLAGGSLVHPSSEILKARMAGTRRYVQEHPWLMAAFSKSGMSLFAWALSL